LSSFKIMSRFAVEQILKYQGPFPYIDGLLLQCVSRMGTVIVPHHDRRAGKSSYTLFRLLSLWLNAFTNFSIVPLRVAFILGLLGFAVGGAVVALLVYERVSPSGLPAGFLMLMTATIFLSSTMLIVVGLIGEYVGRVLLNINGKPQFVVRSVADGQHDKLTDETNQSEVPASRGPQ
jgi:undecaprenyl-phosphate 4-deoxy-4-formamido-L-arabinose transferase